MHQYGNIVTISNATNLETIFILTSIYLLKKQSLPKSACEQPVMSAPDTSQNA